MKVSVCITIFNEPQESVNKLLNALNRQTLKASEIVITDASNSKFQILKSKKYPNIKIINSKGVSRSEGRNIAIKKTKNEIIAITDAGCVPHKGWLARLCSSFEKVEVKNLVVVGGYKMIAKNSFEKAEAVFLGVKQQNMNSDFMPSARSMAFTKTIWKKAGGFPENLNDTAEDNVFNLNLLEAGAKFVVAKKAIVDWQMPDSIKSFYIKIKNYARGDAQSGIWWHPVKKWKTHNLKVLTIFLRYLVLIILFLFNKPLCLLYVLCYMLYGYSKAKLWGIYLQFISDFACMVGFVEGMRLLHFVRNDRSGKI